MSAFSETWLIDNEALWSHDPRVTRFILAVAYDAKVEYDPALTECLKRAAHQDAVPPRGPQPLQPPAASQPQADSLALAPWARKGRA